MHQQLTELYVFELYNFTVIRYIFVFPDENLPHFCVFPKIISDFFFYSLTQWRDTVSDSDDSALNYQKLCQTSKLLNLFYKSSVKFFEGSSVETCLNINF